MEQNFKIFVACSFDRGEVMRSVYVLALFLAFSAFLMMVESGYSLPFDVEPPPKCYFCCDVNFDGQVDLYDVFVIVRSYGSTRDMPKWNPVADVNRDGMIDIFDVVMVIRCVFSCKILPR